jgi:hypothetical protein
VVVAERVVVCLIFATVCADALCVHGVGDEFDGLALDLVLVGYGAAHEILGKAE